MKKRYAFTYKFEDLTEIQIKERRLAGEKFGYCDAFLFCPIVKTEDGKPSAVHFVSQDVEALPEGEIPPEGLSGGPMAQSRIFILWLGLAQMLSQEGGDLKEENKALAFAVLNKYVSIQEAHKNDSPSV